MTAKKNKGGRPRLEVERARVNIVLEQGTMRRIKALAGADDPMRSVASMLRKLIALGMEAYEQRAQSRK